MLLEIPSNIPDRRPGDGRLKGTEGLSVSILDFLNCRSSPINIEPTSAASDQQVSNSPKLSANWIMGELSAELNNENLSINESKITSNQLGQLILRIEDGTISGKIAKEIFEKLWSSDNEVDEIIQGEGLEQVTDDKEIESMIDEVINSNPEQLEQYRSGKDRLFGFFVGQVMKASQGKANPKQVNDILRKKLEK